MLSSPKSVTTLRELKFSKNPATACVVPPGSKVQVFFSQVYPDRLFFDINGVMRVSMVANAHRNFTGFNKVPGTNTLFKWDMNGYAMTPTGKKTEPDGFGPDGSPSWFLVQGLI